MGGAPTFEEVFRREYLPVRRTVALIVGSTETADEVTQDAFTELYVRWWRVSRYERPGAWVRRVAIRRAVRVAGRVVAEAHLEKRAAGPLSGEHSTLDVDLLEAIAELPAQQRAAIVLRYYTDLPIADVAACLRCSESTARVHLHRARTRLAELLGEVEEAPDATG